MTVPTMMGGGMSNANYNNALLQASALQNVSAQQQLALMQHIYNSGLMSGGQYQANPAVKKGPLPITTKFGEIIAHRFWNYHRGFLKAASADYIWMPGKVAGLKEGQKLEDYGAAGVHAFKEQDRMLLQSYSGDLVFGTVKLWGDVIEYEHGYHAEFASITSLDHADLPSMKAHERAILDELRQRYGVQVAA